MNMITAQESHTKQKVWMEEVLEEVNVQGLEDVKETDKGLEVGYDPTVFSVTQANEMMAIAERDGVFSEYFIDVKANKVCFNY